VVGYLDDDDRLHGHVLNGLPIFSPDDLPGLVPWAQLQQSLGALHMAKGVNDVALIRVLLQQLVAGYEPSGEVVDWVYLAQEREAVLTSLSYTLTRSPFRLPYIQKPHAP
jgi:hypothetical protein